MTENNALEKFDEIFRVEVLEELLELFNYGSDEDSEAYAFIDHGQELGESFVGLILINTSTRETKRYWRPYIGKVVHVDENQLMDFTYGLAIFLLVKWNRILIENELEGLVTYDQYFVWRLREYYGLSYTLIAGLRKHFGKSSNESTIRDLYMKAKMKMQIVFEFCDKYPKSLRRS